MKRVYERPMMYMEEFAVNRAIAGGCLQKKVVFDCMMGPNTDTTNVITVADSCANKAGTTSLKTAIHGSHNNGWGHSDGTGGTWEKSTNGWKYTAPGDAVGLLYICSSGSGNGFGSSNASFSTTSWSESNGVLTHSNGHTGNYHCQIAPVYNLSDVAVGS